MFWTQYQFLCQRAGKSPNGVAKEIGLSSGIVTFWKNGKIPKSDTLKKIADYFGVSVDYLLGSEPKEKAPVAETEDADELNELLQELKTRPEMKMLFSLAKGATKEDVELAITIIERMRRDENDG